MQTAAAEDKSKAATCEPVLWSYEDLKREIEKSKQYQDVVQDMVPAASVNIAVGESGIGKSPLFYDMVIRVAAGLPFLGCRVQQGPTLMLDCENGAEKEKVCDALLRHAGLAQMPELLRIDPSPGDGFAWKVRHWRPILVVIDSLRMFRPEAMKGDGIDAVRLLRELQALAREVGTAFVLIHHLRKEDKKFKLPDLASTSVLEWMQEASGSRAFINQTDARMAIAKDRKARDGDDVLIVKHYIKLRGEFGPQYVERVFENGEPIGYRRLSGDSLLRNSDHESLFRRLPAQFSHSEAEAITGKKGGALSNFLKKCIGAGVLTKQDGIYQKVQVQ